MSAATSAEEDFNNHVDRRNCSVDTSQPLFSFALPLSNGLINKVAMVAKMEVTHGVCTMEIYHHKLCEGQCFILARRDAFPGCGSDCSHTWFCQTYHPCTYRMLYVQLGALQSIISDQGIHFTAREVWQWAHAPGIPWSYRIPYYPEAAGSIEQWNGLLKTQLQCLLGGNTLQGQGEVLWQVYILYISAQYMVLFLRLTRIKGLK